jgi:hypothetical protein
VSEDRSPSGPGDARRRALRRALASGAERLRVVAEDVLGAETRIDWVCAGPDGETVVVLHADPGLDLELVARGLAQRAWVEARLPDWLKLAPELGLRPPAGVRALLLCPAFGAEARAAAHAVPPGTIRLATCHFEHEGSELRAWIAPVEGSPTRSAPATPAAPGPAPAAEFRTGLSDLDLGVTEEEMSALEQLTPRELAPPFRSD